LVAPGVPSARSGGLFKGGCRPGDAGIVLEIIDKSAKAKKFCPSKKDLGIRSLNLAFCGGQRQFSCSLIDFLSHQPKDIPKQLPETIRFSF
jgi:hypothetical protein